MELNDSRRIMPICFAVAAASYWAIGILMTTGEPFYFALPSLQIDGTYAWLLFRLVLFTLCFVFYKRISAAAVWPFLSILSASLFIIGQYLPILLESPSSVFMLLSYLLKAVGYVGLFLTLVPYIASLRNWNTKLVAISISMTIGFLEILLIGYLPNTIAVFDMGMLLVLAAFAGAILNSLLAPDRQQSKASKPPRNELQASGLDPKSPSLGIPFTMLVGFIALSVPLAFFRSFSITSEATVEYTLVIALAFIFSLIAWVFNKVWSVSGVSQTMYTFWFVSFLLAGMLILSVFGSGLIAGAFIFAGAYLLRAYIFSIFCSFANQNDVVNSIRYLALANLVVMIGHFIGLISSGIARLFSTDLFMHIFIGIIYAVFLGGFYFAFKTQGNKKDPHANETRESDNKPASLSLAIENFCQPAIERYGLTTREGEIVTLLLCGKSVSTIAKTLFLSENTVKSHMNKLYKKMAVHSREELAETVERCAGILPQNARRG